MTISFTDYNNRQFSIATDDLLKIINSEAFVCFYDGAAVASDNNVQPIEWAVATLLQASIRRYQPFIDLVANNKSQWCMCNKSLELLGADLELESDEAMQRRDQMAACFDAFMRPNGIGASIAAKILHKKRPRLIPVMDNYVCTVLNGRSNRSLTGTNITDIIYEKFRPQLRNNRDPLKYVREHMIGGITLSSARLLDIAIWKHADGNKALYGLPQVIAKRLLS
jgi:hypothetical protein